MTRSNNYNQNLLHIYGKADLPRIEKAYKRSCDRILRLTSRGEMKYFRTDLLKDLRCAYESLKLSIQPSPAPDKPKKRPMSLLTKQTLKLGRRYNITRQKPPVKSFTTGASIIPKDCPDNKRTHNGWAIYEDDQQIKKTKLQLEDRFCREIILRLEGDLIRYDARGELMQLAKDWKVPLFRANMLLAQIIEAIRTNNLHIGNTQRPLKTRKKDKSKKALIIVFLFSLFITIEYLIIQHLG